MKLKTKRLLAAALALSLTANISLAAFAVSYDIDINSVYVDGNTSWQGDEDTADEDKYTLKEDEDVYIYSESGNATENTVEISGEVDNSVIIDDVTFEVNDDYSAAITITDGSVVDDLTIKDTEITVNGTGSAGIDVGDSATANITLQDGDDDEDDDAVDIELNAAGTTGTAGIKTGEDSDVTLVVNDTTTIHAGEATEEGYDDILDQISLQEDQPKNSVNMAGIVVGGEATDGFGEEGNTAKLTITTGDDEEGTLIIEDVATGIQVKTDSTLIIDGNEDGGGSLEVDINDIHRTTENTVSGTGILNYGTTTITDGATVKITDATDSKNTVGVATDSEGYVTDSDGNTITYVGSDYGIYKVIQTYDAETDTYIYTGEDGSTFTLIKNGSKYTLVYSNDTTQEMQMYSGPIQNVGGTNIRGVVQPCALAYDATTNTYYSMNEKINAGETYSVDSEGYLVYSGTNTRYIDTLTGEYVKAVLKSNSSALVTGKDQINANGINSAKGTLTIEDGSTVEISGIYDMGTSAGIYLEKGGDLVVDNSTLKIYDLGSTVDSQGAGIWAEGSQWNSDVKDGSTTVTIKNGSIVEITDITGGRGIAAEAGSDVNILEKSNVSISDVTGTYAMGIDLEGGSDSATLTVDDSTLTITDTDRSQIEANYSNVYIQNGAQLTTSGGMYGIYIYSTATSGKRELVIQGEGTVVKIDNTDWDAIYVGPNAEAQIIRNSVVNLGTNGNHSIQIDSASSLPASLIVDDAELYAESGIVLNGVEDSDEDTYPQLWIMSGAKVETPFVWNFGGYDYKFYITGGTLELTGNDEALLSSLDAETLSVIGNTGGAKAWPTNSPSNGDEDLTNFRLSITDLEALLGEDAVAVLKAAGTDLSEDEKEYYLENCGFVIEYDDEGNPATLTFQTWGMGADGNYKEYNEDEANSSLTYNENGDKLTNNSWYVVDLSVYDEEELEDLWVWTPAVVLSYFGLHTDKNLDNAVYDDESDPENVAVGDELTTYHDVVIRGQSLDFGNFQTADDYTTTNELGDGVRAYDLAVVKAVEGGYTLFIYDPMDYGTESSEVSAEDLEGKTIIVKDDDGKFYVVNDDGSTSEEATGTYYYALTDADGNFIRVKIDDDGYIVLDENGNFILDDEGGYVYTDEDGNLLNVSLNSVATNDVRVVVSGTGYAILNDDGTYSSTDANGNPVTAETAGAVQVATAVYYYAQTAEDGTVTYVDENGNVLNVSNSTSIVLAVLDSNETYVLYDEETGKYYLVNVNGEYGDKALDLTSQWEPFTSTSRVRSNSYATDSTAYNFENIFGGIGTPVDIVEPGVSKLNVVIAEENDEPEEPDETEEPDEPVIPIVPVVPADPSTPAQPETPAETPTETPAETPADPEAPAAPAEPATPASSTPKTGDDSNVAIYLVMAALSGAALIGLGVTGRKKNEEV